MFNVVFGLLLTISSLLFVLLLCIVYFSKKGSLLLKNKLYRYMIIISIIIIITEIINSIYFYLSDNYLINIFLLKIHWFFGLVFMFLLYNYDLVFLNDYECDSLFKLFKLNKKLNISFLLFIISIIIYVIMPFNNIDKLNINYIPGSAAYFVIFYSIIISVLIIIETFKKDINKLKTKKIAVYLLMGELIVVLIFQLLFPKVSIWGISFALQLFFLYFIIENPDLKLISDIKEANLKLEKSKMIKSDFISSMSHEIRTPMNAIMGFSQNLMLSKTYNYESAKEEINNIYLASNSLLDIVNNIIDVTKINDNKEKLTLKEYKLSDLINELVSIIKIRLDNKDINFILKVDPKLPNVLFGDDTKLFQVLLNVLTNAVKYTDKGSIKFIIDGIKNNDEVMLNIKVIDTGSGIKKEDYNKIFEKYERVDSLKTNEIEGSGLGLLITKKYIDLMNGKITFESEYKKGTTFFINVKQKIISKEKIGELKK